MAHRMTPHVEFLHFLLWKRGAAQTKQKVGPHLTSPSFGGLDSDSDSRTRLPGPAPLVLPWVAKAAAAAAAVMTATI